MRDYAEINADMQEARRKLQEIDMQLSQLSATARNSPFGREFGGYREQLLAKLRDLRAELLATAEDESKCRREGTFKRVEGAA